MFDPIACHNDPIAVNNVSLCQMMKYYHVKEDLNRNEHLNLNLE